MLGAAADLLTVGMKKPIIAKGPLEKPSSPQRATSTGHSISLRKVVAAVCSSPSRSRSVEKNEGSTCRDPRAQQLETRFEQALKEIEAVSGSISDAQTRLDALELRVAVLSHAGLFDSATGINELVNDHLTQLGEKLRFDAGQQLAAVTAEVRAKADEQLTGLAKQADEQLAGLCSQIQSLTIRMEKQLAFGDDERLHVASPPRQQLAFSTSCDSASSTTAVSTARSCSVPSATGATLAVTHSSAPGRIAGQSAEPVALESPRAQQHAAAGDNCEGLRNDLHNSSCQNWEGPQVPPVMVEEQIREVKDGIASPSRLCSATRSQSPQLSIPRPCIVSSVQAPPRTMSPPRQRGPIDILWRGSNASCVRACPLTSEAFKTGPPAVADLVAKLRNEQQMHPCRAASPHVPIGPQVGVLTPRCSGSPHRSAPAMPSAWPGRRTTWNQNT